MSLLRLRSIGVRLGDHWALRGVSLDLNPGETLGVIGESGAGKSTLVLCLLGLLEVDEGEICLKGEVWTGRSERDRRPLRPLIQAVFQDPMASLPPHLTGWAILEEPLLVHRRGGAAQRMDAAEHVAARVKFPLDALGQRPAALSVGLAQRLCLARALMLDPALLLLDEPLSALDPTLADHMLELLLELKAEGTALLFVSHQLQAMRRLCDRTLVLQEGCPVAYGSTKRLFSDPMEPCLRKLWEAAPRLDGVMN